MTLGRKVTLVIVLAVSVWHLGSVIVWISPSGWVRDRLLRTTRRYVRLTKSDQNWAMFAPDPLSVNRRIIARAEVQGEQGEREVDLTGPVIARMRGLNFARVGKTLKAHDRILAGDEPMYLRGFAAHTCRALARDWHAPVTRLTLLREYQAIVVDPATFRTSRTKAERANLGTYGCD